MNKARDLSRTGAATIFICLIALVGALTACSSSGTTSSTTNSSSSTAADSSQGTAASQISAVKAQLAHLEATPTGVGITKALTSAPSGKRTVVVLANSTAESNQVASGVQAAASALGWASSVVILKTDVPSIQNAYNTAIASHPDLIVGVATNPAFLTQQRAAMKQAGIAYEDIANAYPANASDLPLACIECNAFWSYAGQLMADWAVTKGNQPNSMFVYLADTTAGDLMLDTYSTETHKLCSSCKVSDLKAQVTDIGSNIPSQIVSAIQKDPSIKYLVFEAGGLATGVHAALAQAGLASSVKIVENAPGPADFTSMQQGQVEMGVGFAFQAAGWKLIDVYLRHLQGDTFPSEASGPTDTSAVSLLPVQILTGQNYKSTAFWNGDPNYQAVFKQLWHLG